jgi:DNA invertase Pin-like site-specific DNA recombinase
MAANPQVKRLRCAIYTRKSTEHGLEQEFNSLDAQREACEAYIKSQLHERWEALSTRYDDPAFSGGNLARPALQRLLRDIDAGLIDVVVVYKIDRLTRSLADFAKLVEAFDAKSISFVAVTQQFNTTTSMGRLTLNVLLSFAQFERELSSERVRDKIAASRKKGKWTGGGVPLGYVIKDKKLKIAPASAATVRMIFNRYLALQSFQKLVDELKQKRIVTGTRGTKDKKLSGTSFTYGPLAYLLKNRTYLGETGHKGTWFPGEHEAIVERQVFEQVQQLLRHNSEGRTGRREKNGALLTGLLFDDRGNRMSPSFTVRNGVRYPFYVNSAILKGRKSDAGSVARVSATEVDTAILNALKSRTPAERIEQNIPVQELVKSNISRIVIGVTGITVALNALQDGQAHTLVIPRTVAHKSSRARIEESPEIAPSPNQTLVQAMVRSHVWIRSLVDGTYKSINDLARAADLHPKVIRKRIRMAFLGPDITSSILNGTQPSTMTASDLSRLGNVCWQAQTSAASKL